MNYLDKNISIGEVVTAIPKAAKYLTKIKRALIERQEENI